MRGILSVCYVTFFADFAYRGKLYIGYNPPYIKNFALKILHKLHQLLVGYSIERKTIREV